MKQLNVMLGTRETSEWLLICSSGKSFESQATFCSISNLFRHSTAQMYEL